MDRYRKKPVVIEAMQLTSECDIEVVMWLEESDAAHQCLAQAGDVDTLTAIVIETLEGDMRAEIGDWIIRGVKGEFYPCKPDIFEATYEPAGDE
jgi:hypothetical protein